MNFVNFVVSNDENAMCWDRRDSCHETGSMTIFVNDFSSLFVSSAAVVSVSSSLKKKISPVPIFHSFHLFHSSVVKIDHLSSGNERH